MPPYVRPVIADVVVRDDEGQVIPFGERWEDGPPDDTYSVTSHLERFAPLHTVADALIAHLVETYDVELTEGPEVVAAVAAERAVERGSAPMAKPDEDFLVRVVRLVPRGVHGAPLTFLFTNFPGVLLRAGLMQEFAYPSCGCDACDETWEGGADDLEETALGIVEGTFREFVRLAPSMWSGFTLETPNGSQESRARWNDRSLAGIARAVHLAKALREPWEPWPLRTARA